MAGNTLHGNRYGVAETHHSTIFHIALRNPKIWIIIMNQGHLLIFGYHPGQNLPPFEKSVC